MSALTGLRYFRKHWWAPEVVPIVAVVGAGCVGAAWYVSRLARHQDVVWNQKNDTPWNTIAANEGTKLYNVQPEVTSSWSRKHL